MPQGFNVYEFSYLRIRSEFNNVATLFLPTKMRKPHFLFTSCHYKAAGLAFIIIVPIFFLTCRKYEGFIVRATFNRLTGMLFEMPKYAIRLDLFSNFSR